MPESLPSRFYVDAAVYERERVAVFGQEWLILGRTAELASTGGYIAEEIAGYPVFVAVDAGGVPWAYHNVCPHRAGPILLPGRGHTDQLVCQYHRWCFSYQGELIDAPDFGDRAALDPVTTRLREISMANWGGLLWVNLAGAATPLDEALGDMAVECEDIAFDQLVHTAHVSTTMDCNWKLVVENFLEDYHVAGTHPILETHFDMANAVVRATDSYTVQETRTRSGQRMRWFYVYPNVVLQVLDDAVSWMQILPETPSRTRLVLDHYAPAGTGDEALRSLCSRLIDEDRVLCELVQRNLAAGVFGDGHLSPDHEMSISWFRHRLLRAIGHSGNV